MNDEIIKKCEGIDKTKEDSSIIEKFEQIYSNFMIGKRSPKIPKIIKDEEPQEVSKYINNLDIFLDEENLIDNNLENLIRKPSFDLNKNKGKEDSEKNLKEENNKSNNKNKLIKSLIESSKELINKRIIENEIKQINKIKTNADNKGKKEEMNNFKIEIREDKKKEKKLRIHNIIEKMRQNKQKNRKSYEKINQVKVYNVKYNNNKNKYKDKKRNSMKDIYKHIYGIIDNDISINEEKKYNIKNTYQRLYNQGFFTKNKSQINILDNINKIKKESNHKKISKKSKEILGIIKTKNNKKSPHIKYDKNNIYKPIKTNIKYKNEELSFHPELNENTIRIAERLEEPFIRITKPKSHAKIDTPKKKYLKKGEYDRCLSRINCLYLDGVEKIKKRKKLNSCPPTEISDESEFEFYQMKYKINNINLNSNKNSQNTYYKQIQWKKKVIFENIKKRKINNDYDNSECTFKPQISKRNLKYMFKKQLSDTNIKNRKNKNYFDIYFGPKQREFSVSKKRYFIINNEDNNKTSNNNKIYLYYQKNKEKESDKRDKYNKNNVELSMIQRKLYNLEKFFSKQNL